MYNKNVDSDKCIGCSACCYVCNNNAIKIEENKEGFFAVKLNKDKCISCGRCAKVCPIQNGISSSVTKFKQAYAGYAISDNIRNNCASGGVFYHIAKIVIEEFKGTVFGAYMDETFSVEHVGINKIEDLKKIQGSKYVQSNLKDTFNKVRDLLDSGEFVLFSGTGCQVSGLKRVLNKDYDNLLTVDLICHGIPSPGLFKDYVRYLERRYKGKITEYKFRQKNPNDEQSYDTKITLLKNNKTIEKRISGEDDIYTINYLTNALQNKQCYNCKFASMSREGDITLGDYWGGKEAHPELSNINGINLILLNTKKGIDFASYLKKYVVLIKTTEDKLKEKNHQLTEPPHMNKRRDVIYDKYRKCKFNIIYYFVYFLGRKSGLYLIKRKIRSFLR